MTLAGWILSGLALFILLDSILSILLGNLYMHWGLGYAPDFYRILIMRISKLPRALLLGLKLSEMAAGGVLFWLGLKLIS